MFIDKQFGMEVPILLGSENWSALKLSVLGFVPYMAQTDDRGFDCLLVGIVDALQDNPKVCHDLKLQRNKSSSNVDSQSSESSNTFFQIEPGSGLVNLPSDILGANDNAEDVEYLISAPKNLNVSGDASSRMGRSRAIPEHEIALPESAFINNVNSFSNAQEKGSRETSGVNREGWNGGIDILTGEMRSSDKDISKQYPAKEFQTVKTDITIMPWERGRADRVTQQNQDHIFPFNRTMVSAYDTRYFSGADIMKPDVVMKLPLQNEGCLTSECIQSGQVIHQEQNKGLVLTEADVKPEIAIFNINNRSTTENLMGLQYVREPSEIIKVDENRVVVIKHNGTSIEISIEPDGMGKLDIELSLDKGVVNAQINASEGIGKELIEKNLYSIIDALIREGLNVGDFSVSLRNRKEEMKENLSEGEPKEPRLSKEIQFPVRYDGMCTISIFI